MARCPFLNGSLGRTPSTESKASVEEPIGYGMVEDQVSISPFEPASSDGLSKTCVSSAAKATMAALPGVAKAGCPHAA